jgi:oligoendopeptidase F
MNNLFTLAHELGHAYHNEVIYSLPGFAQHYPMNVAETASTLAETIVIDEMIHQSDHLKIKKSLLDFKLQRAVIFLMNIHARFLFETRFYEERKKGFVLPKTLNVLMEDAQKEAYCDALEEWHPHFWIAKQHFYFSDYPFYNFPYTFGYLFSLGIYSFLKKGEGTSFQNYEALLKDTGQMNVEELALKHLRTDLTTQDFWMRALKLIQNDVNLFLSL